MGHDVVYENRLPQINHALIYVAHRYSITTATNTSVYIYAAFFFSWGWGGLQKLCICSHNDMGTIYKRTVGQREPSALRCVHASCKTIISLSLKEKKHEKTLIILCTGDTKGARTVWLFGIDRHILRLETICCNSLSIDHESR